LGQEMAGVGSPGSVVHTDAIPGLKSAVGANYGIKRHVSQILPRAPPLSPRGRGPVGSDDAPHFFRVNPIFFLREFSFLFHVVRDVGKIWMGIFSHFQKSVSVQILQA